MEYSTQRKGGRFPAALAAAVILLCLFTGLISEDPEYRAKELICQRTDILQAAAQGDISYAEAEQRLRKIEKDVLLKEDLGLLKKHYREKETCHYGVLRRIQQKKQYYQYTTYEAELILSQKGSDIIQMYNAVVKKEGEELVLTVFEPAKV